MTPPFAQGRLWDSATSYGCTTNQKAPLCKGGARSARAVREAARSKPSKARSIASEPCERSEATMPHCGMLSASADGVASAKLLGLSVRPLPFHCTTLAMSCPAPRLAASVLGLLYSNRSWHTTRQRNFTQPALSQEKETGLVLLCVYYSPTMANKPLSVSSAS